MGKTEGKMTKDMFAVFETKLVYVLRMADRYIHLLGMLVTSLRTWQIDIYTSWAC